MIKKDIFQKLAQKTSRVPQPESYYFGTGKSRPLPVKNILLFCRNTGQVMPTRRDASHPRYLLITSLIGPGEAIVDGVRFLLPERHAMLVFPHQYHHFYFTPEKLNWVMLTFECEANEGLIQLKNRTTTINEQYCIYLSLLCDEFQKGRISTLDSLKCENLTSLLLNELCHSCDSAQQSAPASEFIDEVNTYISQHDPSSITVENIAAHFGYSTSHFRSLFRQKMKLSFGKYLKETRLFKARTLLGNSNLSIGEIAPICGYSSVYAFSNAFKHFSGTSPARYRKMHQT